MRLSKANLKPGSVWTCLLRSPRRHSAQVSPLLRPGIYTFDLARGRGSRDVPSASRPFNTWTRSAQVTSLTMSALPRSNAQADLNSVQVAMELANLKGSKEEAEKESTYFTTGLLIYLLQNHVYLLYLGCFRSSVL